MASQESINWAIYESLPPEEAQYQLAHINESKRASIVVTYVVCIPLLVLAIAMRFISRRISRTKYGADDWVTLLGSILAFINLVPASLAFFKFGGGQHAILMTDPISFGKCSYVTDCFYPITVGIIKISTLLLFARIFSSRHFVRILWAVGLFISTYTAFAVLIIMFQCKPIDGYWHPNLEADCLDSTKVLTAIASLNVTTDFVVVCLPLPFLWKLQMRRGMKLQLMGIFSVGSFASIISIYRITQLHVLSGDSYDRSWDIVAPFLSSIMEVSALTLGACAITYRPLLNWICGIRAPSARSDAQRPSVGAAQQFGTRTRIASDLNVGMDIRMQARNFIHSAHLPSINGPRILGTEDGFRRIPDPTEV